MIQVTFLPDNITVMVEAGSTLLQAQILAGLHPDAPCGSKGTCGKCMVKISGEDVPACRTRIFVDTTVTLPQWEGSVVLSGGLSIPLCPDGLHEYVAAFDLGTTTLVGYLLDGKTGALLTTSSAMNPQVRYGADVITRIETALKGEGPALQQCILEALQQLLAELSDKAGIRAADIDLISVAGNTAMHHLLLGIDPKPLVTPPYMPAVRDAIEMDAASLLPVCPRAALRILPNIAGFVGGDTVACMTAVDFGRLEKLTLMLDIGTNGEIVLGNRQQRIACSSAAGPAFEGARISMGMRGSPGAIDHVWIEGGRLCHHTIGGGQAQGICGSGLLDLVACLLDLGILDESGYLHGKEYTIPGTTIVLTQKDIREFQLAKAAIRAGIELSCRHLGIEPKEIHSVLLAGAFGSHMDPSSACRVGMIPPVLQDRICSVGNAAGEGAKHCAVSRDAYEYSKKLAAETEFLELASSRDFQDCFVDALQFSGEDDL